MTQEVFSPKGSMQGYSLRSYIIKNKELIKAFGSATFAFGVAILAWQNVNVPEPVIIAGSGVAGVVFHMFVSAIEFRQAEVKLE